VNLEDLVPKAAGGLTIRLSEEVVNNLSLLDWERVQVDVFNGFDLARLHKPAELGQRHPFLCVVVTSPSPSPSTATATITPAPSATVATAVTATSEFDKKGQENSFNLMWGKSCGFTRVIAQLQSRELSGS
jgi:hypothetical protein